MTQCPKCEQSFTYVKIVAIKGHAPGGSKWNCIAYNCPHCSTCISVQIDPIAIKTDTVNEIKRR